ncbi:helix-turn-helix domain-containing protein [Salinibacter sp.]|uniref:helix-turn-helix domain-containing protein n=1 Tax=Salinibacter sp. TaxID=2065818 RepID=UPI003D74E84A
MNSTARSTEDEASTTKNSGERLRKLEKRVAQLEKRLEEEKSSPEGLLTVKEVADYLSVSKRTVERIIDRGRLNPLWVGGQRRFEPEGIRSYLRNST